ncbi:MAG: vWA domain-containing protein [Planctomycetota bacterium]
MTFVTPWTALFAAAITVPLLLLLYFLKLRRRPLRMASTLLWRKTFEDLQVNVPFQRLRFTVLLLLQILLLATLLLALAQPRLESGPAAASRVILLIDRSASMRTIVDPDTGRTRLDEAKDAAAQLVDRLGRGREASQMMLVAFGASAQVISGFESQRRTLSELIDAIEPTDEEANLDLALQLAGAFAGRREDATEDPPDVVLVSDGGVAPSADAGGFRLRAGRFRFLRVGADATSEPENLGIASFSARRDYDDPARVLVFARLINASASDVETTVRMEAEGAAPHVRRLTIPAATPDGAGEAPLTHAFDLPGGSLLTIQQSRTDMLASDDTAAIVLPPPARPRIAIVHPGDGPDTFLQDVLEATDPDELRLLTGAAFETLDPAALDAGETFDLVVFDRVAAARLPGVPTLSVGAVPAGLGMLEPTRPGGQRILSWDRQHPAMRHVSLDTIVFAETGGIDLPATATPLAFGPDGPIMAVLRTRGARHVVVAFELMRSNWPLHVSFTVFLRNVLDYLTLARSGQQGLTARPGDSLNVRARPGVTEIVVDGPATASVPARGGEPVTLPVLRQVGVYAIDGATEPWSRLAVSVLSDVESDLRPRAAVEVNAESAAATTAAQTAPRELWPWLTMLAAALLVMEWLYYCRRVRS